MLKKANRLTKTKDFDHVFQKGKSSYNKIIGIKVVKNDTENIRVGILVGLKVSKKAVTRNKIKRRIREVFRTNMEKIKPGWDILVITLPLARESGFKELEDSIVNHLRKLNIFK